MMDGFFALLPNLLIALVVFFIFNAIGRVSRNVTFQLTSHAKFDKTLSNALGKLAAVFVNVLGILVCASIVVPTFTPDKLIAGLGITSVAIVLFQNILQNFFAGVLLLWQKPFVIGDEIKCKDYEGTVEDIEIRTTLLRTYTGERVYIPNGILFTDPVTVNTAYATRQIRMQIPSGKVPPETAVTLAKKALADINSLSKDKQPEVYASSQSGGTVVEVYAWSAPQNAKVIRTKHEIMLLFNESSTCTTKRKRSQKQPKKNGNGKQKRGTVSGATLIFDRDLHLEEAVQHSAHSGLIYSAVKAVIEA